MIAYLETEDFEAALAGMEATDVNARWQAAMAEFLVPPMRRIEEVFHLGLRLRGHRSRRGERLRGARKLRRRAHGTRAMHRFQNRLVRLPDGLHWNLLALFTEAVDGLRALDVPLRGVGVDTWGVDYALLDRRGGLLGLPSHYRDSRTEGMIARADARVPAVERYEVTGIQTMPINTVFQLPPTPGRRPRWIALVPDLLAYWLCGELANEITNAHPPASTRGPGPGRARMIRRLGLPVAPFAGHPVRPA